MTIPYPCQHCGGPTKVLNQFFEHRGKFRKDGIYLRECRACFKRFTTEESVVGGEDTFHSYMEIQS